MIRHIIRYSIDNPFVVVVGFLLVAGWGLWALDETPVDAIPDVSDNQVIVYTEWPGRGPALVEDQITYPLTSNLQGIPGARVVRGLSMFGASMVYAIFEDDVDLYWARSRVLEKLDSVGDQLPMGVVPKLGPDGTGVGHVFWYTIENDGTAPPRSLDELRSIQDWYVRWKLAALDGVAEVASIGGFVRQYQIDLDPNKLRAFGMSTEMVMHAVDNANLDVGGRVLEMADAEYVVRARGYLGGVVDIEDIVVGARNDGAPVRVGDLGVVQLGGDMRRGVLEKNGDGEVVGGIIVMRQGENAKQVIDSVQDKIDEISRGLPDGVHIVPAYDRSDLIDRSVDTLEHALLEEAVIVCIVVLVFLFHFRSALVVVATLPMAVLIAFIAMRYLHITSNIMSLGGIAIAIGVLVDAAIVMVENAYRQLQEAPPDADRRKIILQASGQVGPAIFFSLLIIVASFVPVFMLTGQEGRLFSPLAWTKTLAMMGSAVLAITLVPVLMTLLLRGRLRPEGSNPLTGILTAIYTPILKWSLRHKLTVLAVNLIALALAVPLSLNIVASLVGLPVFPSLELDGWGDDRPELVLEPIGTEVLVTPDEGDLLYMPTTLPNITVTEAKRILQVTDKVFSQHPQVELVLGKVGRAETSTDPAPMSMIETYIKLAPQETWPEGKRIEDIVAELDAASRTTGVVNGWTQPIINRIQMLATGIRTDVGIKFYGSDLDVLADLALQAEAIVRPIEGVQDLYAERVTGGRFVDITIDRKAAARFGVNVVDVNRIVEVAIGGMPVTTTVEGRERYPVRIRYLADFRDSPEALGDVLITTASGEQRPLSDVAKIEILDGPPMVKSENGDLMSVTMFNVRGRDMGSVLSDVEQALAEQLDVPPGYSYAISGEYENQQRLQSRLRIILPVALVIIFMLLYFTFKDTVEALMVMLSVPFAMIGGIYLLYALDLDFSVAVWVGFISLFGVAVETGVVMVVYLHEALDRRLAQGAVSRKDLYEATVEGSVQRLRPKLMTVSTTLLGLAPLLWASGTGSDVMLPIAVPMVGGILTSAIHVLLVTPVIFVLMKEAALRRGRLHVSGMHH